MAKFKAGLALLSLFIFTPGAISSDVKEYVLETGQKGSRRLELQNNLLQPHTDEHLREAGISKGQSVCDIGCGNGIMTEQLAKLVGPAGHVWAIDFNIDQLKLTQERIERTGLKNVTFVHGDIRTLKDLPFGSIDLVYIRFVLSHVNDPENIIRVVKDLLKEGGVVASQEPTMTTFYDSSDHEIFCQYRNTIRLLKGKTGNDYEIGERLLSLYDQAGFTKTQGYFIQPKMNFLTTKELFLLDIAEWTGKAIQLGILTSDTVENWRFTMNTWPDTDSTQFTMANYAYVLAWK
jgi:ubiquinone/menaquinone biosynthesis C-methylase UbiE